MRKEASRASMNDGVTISHDMAAIAIIVPVTITRLSSVLALTDPIISPANIEAILPTLLYKAIASPEALNPVGSARNRLLIMAIEFLPKLMKIKAKMNIK